MSYVTAPIRDITVVTSNKQNDAISLKLTSLEFSREGILKSFEAKIQDSHQNSPQNTHLLSVDLVGLSLQIGISLTGSFELHYQNKSDSEVCSCSVPTNLSGHVHSHEKFTFLKNGGLKIEVNAPLTVKGLQSYKHVGHKFTSKTGVDRTLSSAISPQFSRDPYEISFTGPLDLEIPISYRDKGNGITTPLAYLDSILDAKHRVTDVAVKDFIPNVQDYFRTIRNITLDKAQEIYESKEAPELKRIFPTLDAFKAGLNRSFDELENDTAELIDILKTNLLVSDEAFLKLPKST